VTRWMLASLIIVGGALSGRALWTPDSELNDAAVFDIEDDLAIASPLLLNRDSLLFIEGRTGDLRLALADSSGSRVIQSVMELHPALRPTRVLSVQGNAVLWQPIAQRLQHVFDNEGFQELAIRADVEGFLEGVKNRAGITYVWTHRIGKEGPDSVLISVVEADTVPPRRIWSGSAELYEVYPIDDGQHRTVAGWAAVSFLPTGEAVVARGDGSLVWVDLSTGDVTRKVGLADSTGTLARVHPVGRERLLAIRRIGDSVAVHSVRFDGGWPREARIASYPGKGRVRIIPSVAAGTTHWVAVETKGVELRLLHPAQ